VRLTAEVERIAAHAPSRLLQLREVAVLDHAAVHHELDRPAVGLQLDGRGVVGGVDVSQRVVSALVEIDEDLLCLRKMPIALPIPEDHRSSVPDGGYPGVRDRVVRHAGDDFTLPIQAGVERDLGVCRR
jgi:hypothetical protein